MFSSDWATWLDSHRDQLESTVGDVAEDHPALYANTTICRLCGAIRQEDPRAIKLALTLLRDDPRMPFGRTLKSQIARAFKSIASSLSADQRDQIIRYRDKLLALDHPPRETAEFDRVVRSFRPS